MKKKIIEYPRFSQKEFLFRCIQCYSSAKTNIQRRNMLFINTTEQSSWAPTSHVLVVNCEATKATISATIKAIPVHRYPLSPFEL